MKKPCRVCPYKKDSAKGYLGESSLNPQEFLTQLESETLHPCHSVVKDWDDEEQVTELTKIHICIGALQFMNNSCKLSQFKNIRDKQKEIGRNDNVFKWRRDFIEYHNQI